MGRRDFVFKWLFYALTALGFVLVQVFGLVHIRIWGVHPFLFPASAQKTDRGLARGLKQ